MPLTRFLKNCLVLKLSFFFFRTYLLLCVQKVGASNLGFKTYSCTRIWSSLSFSAPAVNYTVP